MASVRPRAVIPEAAQRLSGTHGAGVWAWIPARRCASRPGSSLPAGEGRLRAAAPSGGARLGAQARSGVGIAGRRMGWQRKPSIMPAAGHGRTEPYARRSPPRSAFARVGPPLRGGRRAALLSGGVVPEAAQRLSGIHPHGPALWIPALRFASAGMTAVGEDGK